MERSSITESYADDFEQRTMERVASLGHLIQSAAEDMRHHAIGLRMLQEDGQLDQTEMAKLRGENALLKSKIELQDARITRMSNTLTAIYTAMGVSPGHDPEDGGV